MTKVLVVGGYGGFGGRLSRRLSRTGHKVLVGGRSRAKAARFCAGLDHCRAVEIDRQGDVATILSAERPDIVVDAAGPFQTSDYRLVEECIAACISYLDLADSRRFVTGISRFDEQAKAAGVTVIAGASSVPALSHAVVQELVCGLDGVAAVEISISASSRAAAGNSVAQAILGGAGQPLRRWAGRRWRTDHGWQSLRRERFELPSSKALRKRMVALADVPDLDLLQQRLPGVSAISFRAGTESRLANAGLWLASWLIRGGLMRSLSSFAGLLMPAHRLTSLWGGDKSGMLVRIFGTAGQQRLERRWTLLAEKGDGPEIPTLAAALLVDRMSRGEVACGARDAGGELSLADFEPLFAELAVHHAMVEIAQPPALYARVMGAGFDRLSPGLQSIHGVLRDGGAAGLATVTRGRHPLARLMAWAMRFPPAGEHALHVHFEEMDGIERWTRDFGGHRFSSRLAAERNHLIERFGPLRFAFALSVDDDGGLRMLLERWSLGVLPLPRGLAPRSAAREWQENGKFHFDVPIDLPLIGRVVHYRGWLDAGTPSAG